MKLQEMNHMNSLICTVNQLNKKFIFEWKYSKWMKLIVWWLNYSKWLGWIVDWWMKWIAD